ATYNFININKAAVNLYGYSKEEFTRMNAKDIKVPEEHSFLDVVAQTGKEFKSIDEVVKHKKKNGDIIDVKITAHLINYEGRDVWLAAGRDITQKLIDEQRLKENEQ